MTKNEMIKLLSTHAGKKIEYGNQFYGVLLEDSFAADFIPEICQYWSFTEKEVLLVILIATDAVKRNLLNSGKYNAFDDGIDLDIIQWGVEIYDKFKRILPDNDYYTFSDESEEIFESFIKAEAALEARIEECGYSEITPYEDLDEDRLSGLISDFGISINE